MPGFDCHILMYHHVAPEGDLKRLTPYVVYPDIFREQLQQLANAGFQTMHLNSLLDNLPRIQKDGSRVAVITFDDCAQSLLNYAVPHLLDFGFTASFFVPAGKLGGENDWDPALEFPRVGIMSDKEITQLIEHGFEIGSHGMQHVRLDSVPRDIALHELTASRRTLEDKFGIPVKFHAYPFGAPPADYTNLCREAGYRGACSISSPAWGSIEDPFSIRRLLVHNGDTRLRFRLKLTKLFLRYHSRRDRRQNHFETGKL